MTKISTTSELDHVTGKMEVIFTAPNTRFIRTHSMNDRRG
jgi:hypothetical protein